MTKASDKPGARESRPRVEFPMRQVQRARRLLKWTGRLAPPLASRLCLKFFMTLRQHARPEREKAWLKEACRFEISGTHRLSGYSWGEGPKVLLGHGWEGRGTQMGAFAVAIAASGMQAVAFDAPGHGRSGGRASLRQFAVAIREMVSERGPFAGFVGHSFGVAGVCFAFTAEGVPVESMGRLVFVAPPDDLHDFIEFFEQLLELSPRVARGFERRLEQLLRAPWEEARYCTQVAAADVPLLIVADEGDLETPIVGAEKLVEAWPRAELHRTEGLGHRRILRDPEVVSRVVGFLSGS